jgi:TonB-dependent receptor
MHYSGIQDTAEGYSNSVIQRFPLSMYKSFFYPLPMLLGRYAIDKNLDARLSYTHTFSPPDWMDLVPTKVFTNDDGQEQVDMGNPDLKPTQAHNVDGSIEWYPTAMDMASFGAFYKRMEDYIFSTRGYYENAIYSPYIIAVSSGSHEPITAYSKANGNSADLAGFEANLMQRFLFLPGFLSGFGVNANYTFTWSQALLPGFASYTTLPGQSNHVGNFSLFFEKYGFSARAALNVQSAYIYELDTYIDPAGAKLLLPNYTATHAQLDCALSQKLPGNVTILLEANNITNAPGRLYLDSPAYPTEIEYYSWAVHAGVKVDLNL